MYGNHLLRQLTKLPAHDGAKRTSWGVVVDHPLSTLTVALPQKPLLTSRAGSPTRKRRKTIVTGPGVVMKTYSPFVWCKQCYPSTAILVPYSSFPEVSQGHSPWCGNGWHCNFACLICCATTQFSEKDIRWGTFDCALTERPQQSPAFFAIDIQCEEKLCKFPIRIHFCTDSNTTASAAKIKICTGDFWTVRCSAGHYAIEWRPLAPLFRIAGPTWLHEDEPYRPSREVGTVSSIR
jgi:hypothetical protein